MDIAWIALSHTLHHHLFASAGYSADRQSDEYSCRNMLIQCGTSSGVMLNFEKIEVVNRLKK
jgi:hypothetical protein